MINGKYKSLLYILITKRAKTKQKKNSAKIVQSVGKTCAKKVKYQVVVNKLQIKNLPS